MNARRTHAWLLFGSAVWSSSAYAHSEAMVLGVLLQLALGAGLLAGVTVVAVHRKRISIVWPFAIFLGTLAVVASIWAESLTAIPYAIAYGAFVATLPFVLTYYVARYIATHIHTFWQARKRNSGSQ